MTHVMFDKPIPYKERGRTFDGCDCWGLVVLYYQHIKGILLPHFTDEYTTTKDEDALDRLINNKKSLWLPVEPNAVQNDDLITFRLHGKVSHIGLVIDAKRKLFFHQLGKRCFSGIENYNTHLFWRQSIDGFHRYQPTDGN